MEELLRIENISKIYRVGPYEVKALDDISLSISKGEFLAVMGASGSGKTTLMNILGCLDRPSLGEYFLEGINIREVKDDRLSEIRNKYVGFVFQSFNLVSRTSAFKNIELPMIYAGLDKEARQKKTLELLQEVGLEDRGHHMPNELSGGQKQRVAIARALANNPSMLLADEPTGNLDSQSSTEIMEIFKKLNQERGTSVILVTHEHSIATYAHRIIKFLDGRIIEDSGKRAQYALD